ncbi:hypothetical protein QQS21_011681 [Conoideocrella luteorostrata]|uniref:Uncharacterized protein n=1 Tax=Conoideocrella luteorostrata TaxID=1105319 RepID=A0AAJ0CCY1_9HYPO|nr:hypothetical protein QQS21_011681 [Conoideocrella luteorostrata]
MEEVQKQFPGSDTKTMLEGMQRNTDFEYDVKDTLGTETWDKMNLIMKETFGEKSNEEIKVIKGEARKCLDGHEELQKRFDSTFGKIDAETVALAENYSK